MPTKTKWIQKAMSKKGSKGRLHRELGVPEGKKIPAKKMAKAAKSKNPKIRKQVQMAKNMKRGRK
jgi:hypothetical protein